MPAEADTAPADAANAGPAPWRQCRREIERRWPGPSGRVGPLVFRIGEVAKLTGLTTRTLRYWEELGLVSPSSYGASGDRHYTAADMARVMRIRDLQKLLGFSLAEVRVVLDTEEVDVLDRVRSELRLAPVIPTPGRPARAHRRGHGGQRPPAGPAG